VEVREKLREKPGDMANLMYETAVWDMAPLLIYTHNIPVPVRASLGYSSIVARRDHKG